MSHDLTEAYKWPLGVALSKDNWGILKAGEYAQLRGVPLDSILKETLRGKDGVVVHYRDVDAYLIMYNEHMPCEGRIRWTIAHEIGHIKLGHLTDFKIDQLQRLPDREYEVLEKEADCFAAHFLCPPIIIKQLDPKSPIDLIKNCGLSKEAAKHRFKYYLNWLSIGKVSNLEYNVKNIFF